MSETLQEIQQR